MTRLEKYTLSRWCYAIGEDYIGDVEYRDLHEEMKAVYPENEYVLRSWSDDPCPLALLEKENLLDLYRDIKFEHKSESITSLKCMEEVSQIYSSLNERTRISYKVDGFNIQVNYYNGEVISAETRGRTGNSLNAKVAMRVVPKKIPMLGKVKVTGELVIPNNMWEKFKVETGNSSQRNSVSTAMAKEMTDYLKFVAFNLQSDTADNLIEDIYTSLNEFGFQTPVHMYVSSYGELTKVIAKLSMKSKYYPNPADGFVVENSRGQYALRVGAYEEQTLKSYITGFEKKVGVYKQSIVANIHPIVVEGIKRTSVNVTNLQYVIDCNLQIGNPIAFDIRSMANAVLNEGKTIDLQNEWKGVYDKYREMVDNNESTCSGGT